MGSYNWSKGAASNSEDLNIVTLAEVAAVCKSLAGEADALRPLRRPASMMPAMTA
jgi:hypothetical protein